MVDNYHFVNYHDSKNWNILFHWWVRFQWMLYPIPYLIVLNELVVIHLFKKKITANFFYEWKKNLPGAGVDKVELDFIAVVVLSELVLIGVSVVALLELLLIVVVVEETVVVVENVVIDVVLLVLSLSTAGCA